MLKETNVYVNVIILTDNGITEMDQLKKPIALEFEIKILGDLKYFLRIEVARWRKGIFLSQRKYVFNLLKDIRHVGMQARSYTNRCKPQKWSNMMYHN